MCIRDRGYFIDGSVNTRSPSPRLYRLITHKFKVARGTSLRSVKTGGTDLTSVSSTRQPHKREPARATAPQFREKKKRRLSNVEGRGAWCVRHRAVAPDTSNSAGCLRMSCAGSARERAAAAAAAAAILYPIAQAGGEVPRGIPPLFHQYSQLSL